MHADYKYDAWGNRIEKDVTSGGATVTRRFALDGETGLQFNRARYYDAKTGRWTSQDPLGFDAGDSNLYRYAKNLPTGALDASGLSFTQIPLYLILKDKYDSVANPLKAANVDS